ncbi:DUF262 domain-containing protein [Hymenobacter sp. ASUV-10]|uniref:DUF262 domain-containing protein n=1 Tax=Hymenobacter aranciens TaxID=3063996 RepID=A0ABT9B977_9BACT|nr:DUF262 domain-containing protein [Hymenobacter sp. ASUV-10]MDO7874743.1 DUF262 domain-containing protein [Hymenobacter sp. ASUV-10]
MKTIAELKGYKFLVPQYQRGYRWTKTQVKDLLEDLLHFKDTAATETFYCLQPVLVKPFGEQWELIDGQQRLTTIHILLGYIQGTYRRSVVPLFTLEYATRDESQGYLENIDPARASDNIDFHFMHQARASMAEWFEQQDSPEAVADDIYPTLLRRTKVIWYELAPDLGGEHEAFIRINSGKIPLTNAELIKALFLKRAQVGEPEDQSRFERRQLEMATEWDMIEARLQQPDLWYFLNEGISQQPTRIEFLFELLAGIEKSGREDYATFYYFNEKLAKADTERLLEEWRKVKDLFLLLEEWYNNRDWYHKIGYLITVGEKIGTLVKMARACTKTEFSAYVQKRIKNTVADTWETWNYNDNYRELKNVLLLFNIETLHQNKGASYRFPFRHYKGDGEDARRWSLEHIHAQNSRGLSGKDAYVQWLKDVRRFVVDRMAQVSGATESESEQSEPSQPQQVLDELDALIQQTAIDKDDFELVQKRIFALLGEPDLHTVDNLALLTVSDNSKLSNGVFPQKRALIMELERKGSFIPIATRNVFLKYYSETPENLAYWSADDRRNYVDSIRETLKAYLTPVAAATHAN